jgi:hypothetical protein
MRGCSGRGKHHGTQPTTLGNPRGEWRCIWPTMRWRHPAATERRKGSSVPRCSEEPKLRLYHPKPVFGLKRLSCLSEERRVRSREVTVGGRSWSISGSIATTVGVGNELPQQLGLLIVGLKDRGDRLSQTWRWRRISVPLGVFGPISHIARVHHSAIQTCYH